ncbi:hypothetical protein [Streptomyces sp. NPDC059701]
MSGYVKVLAGAVLDHRWSGRHPLGPSSGSNGSMSDRSSSDAIHGRA